MVERGLDVADESGAGTSACWYEAAYDAAGAAMLGNAAAGLADEGEMIAWEGLLELTRRLRRGAG